MLMRPTRLGRSDVSISGIGLGCLSMSAFYGHKEERDEGQAIATIHRAFDLGINYLDTADMYGMGANEELVGRAVKGQRDRAFIATKFGVVTSVRSGDSAMRGDPAYVRQACEASLRRLGVETIDLYTLHRLDPVTPIEDTVGALAELVSQGKIRFAGLSEVKPAVLRRAQAIHPIAALQTEYSLWSRDPEDGILSTCRELGVTFVAYSPLGRGFLTGAVNDAAQLADDDYRLATPRFQGENFHRNLAAVERFAAIAADKGCTPAQLSLAWVLAQGEDIVPIPGTKRVKYLEENVAALKIALTQADLAEIEAVLPRGFAAGERLPEAAMRFTRIE